MATLDDAKALTAARPTLSALVVVRNEERQLAACLETLRFADEVVVALDRSTDRSAEIAQAFGARVVEGAWPLEGERRTAGVAACRGDWVIEVDADERVTPGLAAEARQVIAATPGDAYFLIPIANHVGGRLVRYGWGAYNGAAARAALYRRGGKIWGQGRVHPPVRYTGERRRLTHPIDHFVDRDLSDMFRRLNSYTDAAAADAIDKGQIPVFRSVVPPHVQPRLEILCRAQGLSRRPLRRGAGAVLGALSDDDLSQGGDADGGGEAEINVTQREQS